MSFHYLLASDEYRRGILSFLWFQDLFRLGISCRESFRTVLESDLILANELLNLLLSKTNRHVPYSPKVGTNMLHICQLAARVSTWPTELALRHHETPSRNHYQIFETEGPLGQKCFSYQGKVMGKNRTVVGNDHFPVTSPTIHCPPLPARPLSALPFTKIVFDGAAGQAVPVLSSIAYYEITVHPSPNLSSSSSSSSLRSPVHSHHQRQQAPCMCIGIARPGFDIYRSMPGWDHYSYGFHGDDGLFFCGDSEHGFRPVGGVVQNKFGQGDTVGLGLVYPRPDVLGEGVAEDRGAIFFTKNGVLHSVLSISDRHFFEHSWFPAIGTDAFNAIEVNFGLRSAFLFDVAALEEGGDPAVLPEVRKTDAFKKMHARLQTVANVPAPAVPTVAHPLFLRPRDHWRRATPRRSDGDSGAVEEPVLLGIEAYTMTAHLLRSLLSDRTSDGSDSRGFFHHRHLVAATAYQIEMEDCEADPDDDEEDENEDEGLANVHPGDMNVIFGTFNAHGQFFPLEGMGGMYPDYDDYEAEEDEEEDDEEPMTASNELADFENISALMAGSAQHTHAAAHSSSSSAPRPELSERDREEEDEDEGEWPRELGEGAMDWKNSLVRALGTEQYRFLLRSGRQIFGPGAASPDRLAELPSPYQRFLRDYPDSALQEFFYDSQADEEDEDYEEEEEEEEDDEEDDEENEAEGERASEDDNEQGRDGEGN